MEFTGERYIPCADTAGQPIEFEHWQRYMVAAKLIKPGQTVLDISCGEGYGSHLLAQTAGMVYGVDISSETVVHAKETYPNARLEFLVGSLDAIPLPDASVDLIACFETIEHVTITVQQGFLSEAKRVLRPNGALIISCPNRPIASDLAWELWSYVNQYHLKEYDIAEFEAFLRQAFHSVQLLYQRQETALILNEPSAQSLSVQWGERKAYENTQNIIAVCGDRAVDLSGLNCMMPDLSEAHLHRERELAAVMRESCQKSQTLDKLAAECAARQSEIERISNILTEHDDILERYKAQIDADMPHIMELDKQIKALHGQLQAAFQELGSSDREKETLYQQIKLDMDHIAELDEQVKALDGQLQAAFQQTASSDREKETLYQQIKFDMDHIAELDEQVKLSMDHIAELNAQAQASDRLHQTDALHIQALQTQIDQLSAEILTWRERVQEQEQQIAGLDSCIAGKAAYINELETAIHADRVRLQGYAARITELETIENSTIWRMTRPLRLFLDWCKKFAITR